jgi:hypothetical protein
MVIVLKDSDLRKNGLEKPSRYVVMGPGWMPDTKRDWQTGR